MNEVEDILRKKKSEIDQLEVPEELETRLRDALKNHVTSKPIIRKWRVNVMALLIAILFIGYHGDTLAFYGKKLIGYDQIMNNNLKQLNELGKGQMIGKSYTFKNGVSITLDGVMLDDNQLLAFYTVKDPKGKVDELNIDDTPIEGILDKYDKMGGQGEMNDEKTEMKWITEFETPFFFEKKLKWSFALIQGEKRENGEIVFTLDRNKAMGHTLKKGLNEIVKVDETQIRFDTILASPTKTVIKGTIQNIVELAKDQMSGERFRPETMDIKLIANGKELIEQGGGMRTDMNGMKFHKEYDPLPADLKEIQIHFVSFGADHDVNKRVEIKNGDTNQLFQVLGQNIEINKVYESKGETYVTITTEESVILSRVYLIIDDKKIELNETISDSYEKKKDGSITHTRTLCYIGIGKNLQLDIQRMKYNKIYNQFITIPID